MWHGKVEPVITEWFEEICRGKPGSIWALRKIMRRLGVRMVVMQGEAAQAGPHVRRNVIYVPRVRGKDRLLRIWLIHELAEIATSYEGIPPMTVPSSSDWDRHLVACAAEQAYQSAE